MLNYQRVFHRKKWFQPKSVIKQETQNGDVVTQWTQAGMCHIGYTAETYQQRGSQRVSPKHCVAMFVIQPGGSNSYLEACGWHWSYQGPFPQGGPCPWMPQWSDQCRSKPPVNSWKWPGFRIADRFFMVFLWVPSWIFLSQFSKLCGSTSCGSAPDPDP